MLAGPGTTVGSMRRALAYTIAALGAAAEIDVDLDVDQRKHLAAQAKTLTPISKKLADVERALDDYDLGDGTTMQARVTVGDNVLDRGVRTANLKTKAGLVGTTGLDATHVFGRRVSVLTEEKIRDEPTKVLEAVTRMDDLPSFAEKKGVVKDLGARAKLQQSLLVERDKGDARRSKLFVAARRAVREAADALASCKGALDAKFPRQKKYVRGFFLDTTPVRKGSGASADVPPIVDAPAPPADPAAAPVKH